jgi:dipeptidyl-peptidase-4
MNFKKLALLFFIGMSSVFGQQKITVESIFTGAFRTKGMDALQAMATTNQYTVLNQNQDRSGLQIDLYDYASLKKVATLIDTKDFPQLSDGIDSYSFSEDEKLML